MALCLMLYWPTLFVLTHMPMPASIHAAQVGDKWLHFVAYFLLVLLIWGVVKPQEAVRWNRAAAWWVLLVLLCYGALDEWSQGWVRGRTADLGDFYADLGAALAGLMLLSVLSFWPAWLTAGALAIFIVSVCAKGDLTEKLPLTTVLVHVISFSLFTLLWLACLSSAPRSEAEPGGAFWRRLGPAPGHARAWCGRALALPLILLATVKLGTWVTGRDFPLVEVGTAAAAVSVCVMAALLFAAVRNRRRATLTQA
jgi:hypothetical protein